MNKYDIPIIAILGFIVLGIIVWKWELVLGGIIAIPIYCIWLLGRYWQLTKKLREDQIKAQLIESELKFLRSNESLDNRF